VPFAIQQLDGCPNCAAASRREVPRCALPTTLGEAQEHHCQTFSRRWPDHPQGRGTNEDGLLLRRPVCCCVQGVEADVFTGILEFTVAERCRNLAKEQAQCASEDESDSDMSDAGIDDCDCECYYGHPDQAYCGSKQLSNATRTSPSCLRHLRPTHCRRLAPAIG